MDKKRLRKKVRKIRTFLIATVSVTLLILSAIGVYGAVNGTGVYADSSYNGVGYHVIVVSEGDSVWSIAKEFGGSNSDLRKFVNSICDLNMIENYIIQPGQRIIIPEINA